MLRLTLNTEDDFIYGQCNMIRAEVASVSWGRASGQAGKQIRLKSAERLQDISDIHVPRSACVTKGDVVFVNSADNGSYSAGPKELYVQCNNGLAQLLPIYAQDSIVRVGSTGLQVTVKEIDEQEEFDGYAALTRYHYRDRIIFGRHSPLVVVTHHPLLPKVIAYIDLATAFLVNTPRRSLLDEPTRLDGIEWDRWTKAVSKKRIPLFVRIARCVVHPEMRSVGLGRILIEHAANFARIHWQSANWKPLFLEISADMLRYIPFAEKAGMNYVGDTEGNLDRIVKDLRYLSSNQDRLQKEIFTADAFGILDAKLSQLSRADNAVNGSGANVGQFVAEQIENPTLDGWAKLAGVVSFPKPHYMMGLNEEAETLITERIESREISSPPTSEGDFYIEQVYRSRLQQEIRVEDVSYQTELSIDRTEATHQIERAFEISLDNMVQVVFQNLNLNIYPGEILVITGLSGSGKTTLLKLLGRKVAPTSGEVHLPAKTKAGLLKPISVAKPLIEVIGRNDPSRGIYWMGVVGLSEPNLYVKPFQALSAGQKYRAMLARLLIRGTNLWLIDEFCENLDAINTNLLSARVSKLARRVGATAAIASSDATRFVKSLRPDKVLVLKGAADTQGHTLYTGDEFIDIAASTP